MAEWSSEGQSKDLALHSATYEKGQVKHSQRHIKKVDEMHVETVKGGPSLPVAVVYSGMLHARHKPLKKGQFNFQGRPWKDALCRIQSARTLPSSTLFPCALEARYGPWPKRRHRPR